MIDRKNFMRPRLLRVGSVRELLSMLIFIVAIYALAELAIPRSTVDGASMQPTLDTGQYLVISRVAYLLGEPQRGDIVVFQRPDYTESQPRLIKRIIGLPGDTIEFRDQQVFLNGELLNEPYIKESCYPSNCPDAVYSLEADQYFMMGDNRNNSRDSREFGPVDRSLIVGEAIIRYWPYPEWGIITRTGYPEQK